MGRIWWGRLQRRGDQVLDPFVANDSRPARSWFVEQTVETIDGEKREDPRADLGRILRQQQFMAALFAKLGDSKNPISLARTASKVTDGLRIDDDMTLPDAIRFAWRLRGLNPVPVPIEPVNDGNGLALSDKSEAALEQFR